MELTFKMGPDGEYDFQQVYCCRHQPLTNPKAHRAFRVTLNIPDSLRGTGTIVVLLETNKLELFTVQIISLINRPV